MFEIILLSEDSYDLMKFIKYNELTLPLNDTHVLLHLYIITVYLIVVAGEELFIDALELFIDVLELLVIGF